MIRNTRKFIHRVYTQYTPYTASIQQLSGLLYVFQQLNNIGAPGFALKAPSGAASMMNTARRARGVSLHRRPPAPKDGGQRWSALIRADFDDSALTVGHQRWVYRHYVWHYLRLCVGQAAVLSPAFSRRPRPHPWARRRSGTAFRRSGGR